MRFPFSPHPPGNSMYEKLQYSWSWLSKVVFITDTVTVMCISEQRTCRLSLVHKHFCAEISPTLNMLSHETPVLEAGRVLENYSRKRNDADYVPGSHKGRMKRV
jgi:hypothetical protein